MPAARSAYNCSLAILARRDHSKHEVAEKLARRGFTKPEITQALDKLIANNLLNDLKFAINYIQYRANSGFGPSKLKYELSLRGLNAETTVQALEISDISWDTIAQSAWQKKFNYRPAGRAEWLKQARFLARRGFSTKQIEAQLKKLP